MKRIVTLFILIQAALLHATVTNSVSFDCQKVGTPAVHDGYLYLPADGALSSGFAVFSIANPKNPIFVAYARTLSSCSGLPLFHGDTAYFTTSRGIELFDITNPEAPSRLRLVLPPHSENVTALADIHDNSLSVKTSDTSFVYDLSDLFAPLLSDAQIDIQDTPQPTTTNQLEDVANQADLPVNDDASASQTNNVKQDNSVISGSFRYVADNESLTLQTYSAQSSDKEALSVSVIKPIISVLPLSAISTTQTVSNHTATSFGGKLLLNGNLLLALANHGNDTNGMPRATLAAFDISDNSSPLLLDSLEIAGFPKGICNSPKTNLVYIADGFRLNAISILPNGSLTNLVSVETSRNFAYGAQSVAVADDGTVLSACGADGIKAYSFNTTNFEFKAIGQTGGFASDLSIDNGAIFVADAMGGLTRLSYKNGIFSNARTYSMPLGTATSVKSKGGIAYATGGELPVVALAKSRPLSYANRTDESELYRNAYACDLSLFNSNGRTFAAIADFGNGVSIFDVTNPRKLAFHSSPLRRADGSQFASNVVSVLVANDRLFVLDAMLGLISIHNPL